MGLGCVQLPVILDSVFFGFLPAHWTTVMGKASEIRDTLRSLINTFSAKCADILVMCVSHALFHAFDAKLLLPGRCSRNVWGFDAVIALTSGLRSAGTSRLLGTTNQKWSIGSGQVPRRWTKLLRARLSITLTLMCGQELRTVSVCVARVQEME